MATYVPPKKNTAYVFYTSLEAAAGGTFQASPTLAAGDVLVATDDGAPANITTLPTVDADFTKRVKVPVSATEMNGDNVTVIFSDATGGEWLDLTVNIQTTAAQVDDLVRSTTPANTLSVDASHRALSDLASILGTALTETTPGWLSAAFKKLFNVVTPVLVASDAMRGTDGAYTGTPPSTADIKTAMEADGSKLDHLWEMTADDGGVRRLTTNALELAPTGGTALTAQDVRDALKLAPTAGDPAAGSVDKHLDDILEDTGTTLPATLAGIGPGPGSSTLPYSLTYTVTDSGTGLPVADVLVELSTDNAKANVIRSARSNSSGVAKFYLSAAGTYYVWRAKDGYSVTDPDLEVVA